MRDRGRRLAKSPLKAFRDVKSVPLGGDKKKKNAGAYDCAGFDAADELVALNVVGSPHASA